MSNELIINCPECDEHDSPKLYINVEKGVFNCFRCNFSGKLAKLKKYPAILEQIQDKAALAAHLKHTTFNKPNNKTADVDLDLSTTSFITEGSEEYVYLLNRGWTKEMISIYSPLTSTDFAFEDRVIIPIYDNQEILTYYIARHIYDDTGQKYKNAAKSKDNILFFSQLDCNILYKYRAVICEGIFDAAKVPNAVALLGKTLAHGQEHELFLFLRNKKEVFICLDKETEIDTKKLISTIRSWFPTITIYSLNHSSFGEKDLGDLAKSNTSHELLNFIVHNSVKVEFNGLTNTLRNRLQLLQLS